MDIVYYRLREKRLISPDSAATLAVPVPLGNKSFSETLTMFPAEKLNNEPAIPDKSTK